MSELLYGKRRHRCPLPNYYDFTDGTVWVCDCGVRWQRAGDPAWSGTGWVDWDAPLRGHWVNRCPFPKMRLRCRFTAVRSKP